MNNYSLVAIAMIQQININFRHPEDETKQQKSREADMQYEEQLIKVRQNIQEFNEHYKKTAEAVQELMDIMVDHFDKCGNMTTDHLKNAKSA